MPLTLNSFVILFAQLGIFPELIGYLHFIAQFVSGGSGSFVKTATMTDSQKHPQLFYEPVQHNSCIWQKQCLGISTLYRLKLFIRQSVDN